MAQWIARSPPKAEVPGSNPGIRLFYGRIYGTWYARSCPQWDVQR